MACSSVVKSGAAWCFYHRKWHFFLLKFAVMADMCRKCIKFIEKLRSFYATFRIMRNRTYQVCALFVCAFLLFGTVDISAQKISKRGYASISEERAQEIVATLADDSFEGREAGTRGGDMAAEYIVSLLDKWGIEPLLPQGYCQEFESAKNQNNWITESDMPLDNLIASGCERRVMKNILACIPGKGNGYVVVGAHYDHLGIDTTLVGDQCYNGADDNASGVAAALQLARAMKKSRQQPERTIIFAFWDGEEQGMLGSRFFVKRTPFLSDISAYMNFDMVGRNSEETPWNVSYIYTADNPVFGEWLQADIQEYKLNLMPLFKASKNLIGSSDVSPFVRKGVPVVWYHTEGHPDYHRPSDTADKVNYPKLMEITRAAYLCLWRLANEPAY